MRKPGGYAFILNPGPASLLKLDDKNAAPSKISEGVTELDTYQCGHCGRQRHVRPKERPEDLGGLCKMCMKNICPRCVNTGRCDPFEAKLARAEERDRTLKSYGL